MHGLGNDFIVLENWEGYSHDYPLLARRLCDRRTGIGADGILVISPSHNASAKMQIFNADGSEAEMCGNGIRCIAKYLVERKKVNSSTFPIETLAGMVTAECSLKQGEVEKVRIALGIPRDGTSSQLLPLSLDSPPPLMRVVVEGKEIEGASISMGNPHFVVQINNLDDLPFHELGRSLSAHPSFPRGANVEFIQKKGEKLVVKVWERGVGPTLACGSGACASGVAGRIYMGMPARIPVVMPGGELEVEWTGKGEVFLTGPAVEVFSGFYKETTLAHSKPT